MKYETISYGLYSRTRKVMEEKRGRYRKKERKKALRLCGGYELGDERYDVAVSDTDSETEIEYGDNNSEDVYAKKNSILKMKFK